MAVRDLVQIGNVILRKRNRPITSFKSPKFKKLLIDLQETMIATGLVGIAAPQIGENYAVFATEPRVTPFRSLEQADILRYYINPKIVEKSDKQVTIYEGCGSVLHSMLFGPVKRPEIITIEALDELGRKFRLRCDGLLARVIQHEYDHLQGIECTDCFSDYSKIMNADTYLKEIRNSAAQISATKITIKEYRIL